MENTKLSQIIYEFEEMIDPVKDRLASELEYKGYDVIDLEKEHRLDNTLYHVALFGKMQAQESGTTFDYRIIYSLDMHHLNLDQTYPHLTINTSIFVANDLNQKQNTASSYQDVSNVVSELVFEANALEY